MSPTKQNVESRTTVAVYVSFNGQVIPVLYFGFVILRKPVIHPDI